MSSNDPVEAFASEALDLLDQIEKALLDLGRDLGDRGAVDEVFRGLHTLKGSGAMFGFDALAGFTHHCETAFDRVRKGLSAATPALVSAVLSARDHMRALIDHRDGPRDERLEAAGNLILAELYAAMPESAGGHQPTGQQTSAATIAPNAPGEGWAIHFKLPPGAMANGTNPAALLQELRDLGECRVRLHLDDLPPFDQFVPTECYLAWDVELHGAATREQIEDVFIFILDDMELTLTPLAPASLPGEAPSGTATAIANAARPDAAAGQADIPAKAVVRPQESVRVQAERLDELMNRVGELVIAQSRLAQLTTRNGQVDPIMLRAVSEDIDRLSSELRDTTMALRMMPVGNLFGRYRRLVYDLAQETGKAITFVTEGEATEVDKTVIERLADPLVHLIRNSCDHGLEPADDRIAAGKSETGQITLSARQAGGEVLISITDDGRGLDRARIRAKAEAQGLIATGTPLSDAALFQMIFHPGFSTASTITNLSGRGVGMDVVKRSIDSLRGTIEIASTQGKGTTFTLHLPLTLAIIECMLVRVGDGRFAIPLSAVEECLELPQTEIIANGRRNFLNVRGQLIPYLRLRESFAVQRPADLHQKVVVVGLGNSERGSSRVGLVVDQIIGNTQTVIKSLSRFHSGLGVFSGATILGDGTVALILDCGHLIALARESQHALAEQTNGEAA
ncbi:chemotaxis protein CheA [Novosphingobium sp.]|uniref:chemotaxis protein CheA n=1 Tax=Novosphingobium sp. TaxID=1874826 RepID=UPI0038B8BFEA